MVDSDWSDLDRVRCRVCRAERWLRLRVSRHSSGDTAHKAVRLCADVGRDVVALASGSRARRQSVTQGGATALLAARGRSASAALDACERCREQQGEAICCS